MKKVSKTSTTTPAAPAPVPAKKVSEKPVKKTLPKPVEAKPVAAPAVKAAPSVATTTKIVAQLDIGFGNTLYVRGEGPGLSWEKGVPLDCVADDQWSLALAGARGPVVFKFLINDLTWSVGDDYVVQPGITALLSPAF
jgi:hypothetical protein